MMTRRRLGIALTIVALAGIAWVSGVRPDALVEGVAEAIAGDSGAVEVRASAASAGKVKPPYSGAYVGVCKPRAPWDMNALVVYSQESSDKKPAVLGWYQSWEPQAQYSPTFLSTQVRSTFANGAIPLITWEPWKPGAGPNQSRYQLADINAGKYDRYIRSWARAIKSVGGPVMLRPMHEMNGSWYPWCGSVNGNSPRQFRKAWRRMHNIFRSEGVTNVTWVWSINCLSQPDTYKNRFAAYYPGDAYVDWTSISGYNWGTSRPGMKWQSFETVYSRPLSYLQKVGKPIIISEIASVPNGGNKAGWIKHTYGKIRTSYPLVKGIVYFDRKDIRSESVQDWRIASDLRSARAYRRAVADPYYAGSPPKTLSAWQALAAP